MSTHEQITNNPTSAVRNTGGRNGPQGLEEPMSDEVLREMCDKNYHQLLPLIAEKMQKEKEQKDKLNAVKARLIYGEESGVKIRSHEESHYSESKTPTARTEPRRRRGDRFDQMVTSTWSSIFLDDRNAMIRFKKKLQILKKVIHIWIAEFKRNQLGQLIEIKSKLHDIDVLLDQGGVNDDILLARKDLMKQLNDFKKRSNLAIKAPVSSRCTPDFRFPKCLSPDQASDLESLVSSDEIRSAVWGCGKDKSPGPDGFTFDFFHKFWSTIGPDFCLAVEWFFKHHSFSKGCNSSFVALYPKKNDPRFVSDYRPISLIGSLYKMVTKVLATCLSLVISDLISDVQSAFLPNRQILDGPFIINELLSWCKHNKQQAMMFKLDFVKAYDFVRCDYLDDVLTFNASPTFEFQFHCELKQRDPLAPYLFILIMESLHLSFSRTVDAGLFKGIQIGPSFMISHLFYVDDAVFIGEWSDNNLTRIMQILHCLSLSSGLKINISKSHLLGVGVPRESVNTAARRLGCSVMSAPFKYLGVMVGVEMKFSLDWGRLTLLKSVLGSTPIYSMSLYKVPKSVLHSMEVIRRKFFYGVNGDDTKITWVSWPKVLAAKEYGGLGVSSFYALNRALLFKWVWRFISQDNSLWFRVIFSIHGSNLSSVDAFHTSLWKSIVREVFSLNSQGDNQLCHIFPRVYALETAKESSVAEKLNGSFSDSFRRNARGGVEEHQLAQLRLLIDPVILSSSVDRWVWDLSSDGDFHVKDIRRLLDEFFLPRDDIATRWVKYVPIKINVFAWRVWLDRLPTRLNLIQRNVSVSSLLCPICSSSSEDISHLLFKCSLAADVFRLICRWWDLTWFPLSSYSEWLNWFKTIRLSSKLKGMLEGVFYVSWWCIWNYRNHLLFSDQLPRKDVIFDDIVTRSFTWCQSRCNSSFSWVSWLQHPHLVSL
ncbi:RNA-directed DNA polymerase, eukaryota [Tanacetum coccineum]